MTKLVERFKQEKKIRIATVDRCVMCGEIIPEGQQVCGLCKHKFDEDYLGFCDNHKINFCSMCGRKLDWESEVE